MLGTSKAIPVLSCCTPLSTIAVRRLEGRCEVDCRIDQFPLAPGEYWLKLGMLAGGTVVDAVEQALHFSVIDGEAFGEGRGFDRGICVAPSKWSLVGPPRPGSGS